ncbi:hypothetical protein FJ959_09670 [Mesorhizobium sp. B2-2-4]|uniref:hypothetical protein n=1 Tax=unclassified Mesorhizobium TaxID=325217 RepID=UPI00112DDBFE|nr:MULTISPECIES: hypothetical protein [unclassified Mesorhizobium]TPM59128.1 hypothetical protein FJ959_09670 [Mesorhizobium sp. B2-2-4]TPM67613.1 hypothetical protein FJ965_10810 [Mesorhizobium sp. B2-2-1]TPN66895.1 hypothetical protein FJ984_15675 [Mesorhizobium sp. B1-1-3]
MTTDRNSTSNVKVQTKRSGAKQAHPADDLSFMHRKPRDIGGINYWNVEPSGSYSRDCDKGHALALEYLNYIGRYPTNGNTTLLGCIVNDMCHVRQEQRLPSQNHLTGLEIGFLLEVNRYAMAAMKVVVQTMGQLNGGAK